MSDETEKTILVKKVYWNGKLDKFKPVNMYAHRILKILGDNRTHFTVENVQKLTSTDFKVDFVKEGLFD
jgi:hypothetical protein